jgi:hypothetical protein
MRTLRGLRGPTLIRIKKIKKTSFVAIPRIHQGISQETIVKKII